MKTNKKVYRKKPEWIPSPLRVTRKKWEAPSRKIRENLPGWYFLLEGKKLFPYREWRGQLRGAVNINALRVAIPRAKMTGHTTAYRKAKQLLRKIRGD